MFYKVLHEHVAILEEAETMDNIQKRYQLGWQIGHPIFSTCTFSSLKKNSLWESNLLNIYMI